MSHIINRLILIAGAWNANGSHDEQLESEFEKWLNRLQVHLATNREGALQYLLAEIAGKEVAA